MNGLDKIIARMESDIRAECDALTANAAENAAAIRRDYQAQADAAARDSAQRAQTQAAEHLEHLNGSSQLACRQRVLAAKQQLIDEAFARTAQALAALPQADYIDLLAALAAENGQRRRGAAAVRPRPGGRGRGGGGRRQRQKARRVLPPVRRDAGHRRRAGAAAGPRGAELQLYGKTAPAAAGGVLRRGAAAV